jgi:hypothetical protein
MDSGKKKNLEDTYERIINVGLCIVPYEDLSGLAAPDLMLFGTTNDEKVFSFSDLDAMFKSQYEQMIGFVPSLDRKRLFTRISNDGNNAFITEEVTLTISSPEEVNAIFIRCSCVMEYIDNQWKLTHWHASTPVETENDHWHMEEWKREKEKLQNLVDQQTADLQIKNRELEIEASIERVRAVAMGMTKPEDMLKVCRVISDQLKQFGVEHIRNVQTVIINEEKGTYHNYQYFTPYDKESFEITECDKNPVVHAMINSMLGSPDAFFTTQITGEELATFRAYRKQDNQFPDPLLDDTESVDGNFFSIGPGGLGITLYRPLNEEGLEIFKRFHNVFSLAYRRFRDIEKAEAQAHEVQIELALERVRARTMAMKSSDELKEVVAGMFDGLKGLSVDPTVCNIVLIDKKTCDSDVWSAHQTTNGLTTYRVYISHFEHPFRKKLIDAFLKKIPFSVHELSGDLKKSYIQYLIEHVDYSEAPEVVTSSNKELVNIDEGIVLSAAYMKFGLLIVSRNGAVSNDESGILQRFAKIFEQTYTRFLDLQKAEAQAREAQIEAALERVRSRSLAMHKTDELQDVVRVVAEELKNTGVILDTGGAVICTYFQDSKDVIHWTATEDAAYPSVPYWLPYFKDELFDEAWESKTRGDDYFAKEFSYDVKNAFFSHAFEHSDYRQLPDEYKKIILESSSHGLAWAWAENSAIMIPSIQGDLPSEEERKILIRFAKVFEQSFIRFLDLQKAEAQTKEANIQLALERVRAKTMAMKTQGDLLGVIELFGDQMIAVGLKFGLVTFIEGPITKTRDWDLWSYTPEAGTPTQKILIPYIEHPYFLKTARNVEEYQKTGEPIQVKTFTKEEKDTFLSHYFKHLPTLPDEVKEFLYANEGEAIVDAFLGEITVSYAKWDSAAPSKEELKLFERFAKEFRQTYIRFLDIKKAEEQAREAQVNLAVERVRARALAMFKSEEILEVVHKLKEEIMGLDIPNVTAATIHLKEPDGRYRAWDLTSISEDENELDISLDIRWHREDTHPDFFMREVWDRTEDYFVVIQGGDRYKHTVEWLHQNGHSDYAEEFEEFLETSQLEKAYHPTVPLSNGRMCIDLLDPPSPEIESILKKMAGAFDLAYKRFEDLQKAEAQTREAKIETALEKVRSRTMGMQRSDELAEVANVLFTEMNDLVHNLWTCGFVLCEKGREEDEWWLSLEDGFSRGFFLPNVNDYAHATLYEGWLEGDAFRTVQLDGDKLQEHYDWLMQIPVAKNIFDEMEAAGMQRPEWQKLHAAYFSKGYLVIITREPCPEEEIFKRFANRYLTKPTPAFLT